MSEFERRLRQSLHRHGVPDAESIVSEVLSSSAPHSRATLAPLETDAEWPSEADAPPESGTVAVQEAFELQHELGRGGMGVVYRARDQALERAVAVKLLRPKFENNPHFRQHFEREARITGRLNHPGIVPIHGIGTLADGRPFYAMQEIEGQTLNEVIDQAWRDGPIGPIELRRLVVAVMRAAEAVSFAHERQVVHRDIKPDNLLLGRHGEVRVVDWGLAVEPGDPPNFAGTPGFMSPEQSWGEQVGPATDVHGFGATLWLAAHGTSAWQGEKDEVIAAVRDPGPRPKPHTGDDDLDAILVDALRYEAAERIPTAGALVARLGGWLDGVDARARALERLEEGRQLFAQRRTLLEQAAVAAAEGERLMRTAGATAPLHEKRDGWAFQDSCARLRAEAALVEEEAVQTLLASLRAAELPETHALLCEHWTERLLAAEARRDDTEAACMELRLHRHLPPHSAGPARTGRLTLVTEPIPAQVLAFRVVERDRMWVPESSGIVVGTGSLAEVELPTGAWQLVATAPGYAPAVLSLRIGRGEHLVLAPRTGERPALRLLPEAQVSAEECYVPAGWLVPGGDPDAPLQLPHEPVWVKGFIAAKYPVTIGEYARYLDDLEASGLAASARYPLHGETGYVSVRAGGRHRLRPANGDDADTLPVVFMSHHDASAYAAWKASKTGQPWRLLTELEWERAARGGDGRRYVWGDRFDPSFCNMMSSLPDGAKLMPVESFPSDRSPYGLRGMGGNAWEWTSSRWLDDGSSGVHQDGRVVRGGSFNNSEIGCHAAYRGAGSPDERSEFVSFRLARDLPGS